MCRSFAVEMKGLRIGADRDDAPGDIDQAGRRGLHARRTGCGPVRAIGRPQGILGEQVQDIGQEEFLVLLLVGQPQIEHGQGAGIAGIEQAVHVSVDMGAVGEDLVQGRPGQHATAGTGMPCTDSVVVGIEKIGKIRMKTGVLAAFRSDDEFLEEPACMRKMPF